jgi:GDPmannose 4,6-dehydratase
MKKCLVLGVNGQDGSYAAEEFLRRGFEVYGVGRQDISKWVFAQPKFSYIKLDLADIDSYQDTLVKVSPDVICYFAALHGSAGFKYENYWRENVTTNIMCVQATLEFLRTTMPKSYFYYLSSSKTFSSEICGPITEGSMRASDCLYSIAKNCSTELITFYRKRYGIKASTIWTFNHESPRRSSNYFIPIIVRVLAQALLLVKAPKEKIETLDFWCDWGSAKEFMSIIADLAQREIVDDFILGTGRPVWARDFVEALFSKFHLQMSDYFVVKRHGGVSTPPSNYAVPSKLEGVLGRIPKENIESICLSILRENYPQAYSQSHFINRLSERGL